MVVYLSVADEPQAAGPSGQRLPAAARIHDRKPTVPEPAVAHPDAVLVIRSAVRRAAQHPPSRSLINLAVVGDYSAHSVANTSLQQLSAVVLAAGYRPMVPAQAPGNFRSGLCTRGGLRCPHDNGVVVRIVSYLAAFQLQHLQARPTRAFCDQGFGQVRIVVSIGAHQRRASDPIRADDPAAVAKVRPGVLETLNVRVGGGGKTEEAQPRDEIVGFACKLLWPRSERVEGVVVVYTPLSLCLRGEPVLFQTSLGPDGSSAVPLRSSRIRLGP